MLAITEKQLLIKALGQFVCEEIARAVKPLHDRIKELETALALVPSTKEMQDFIKIEVESLPKPKDGVDGLAGKDGQDGRDGADGENLSLDDVRDCLNDLVSKAVGSLPEPRHCTGGYIDRNGCCVFTFSDGTHADMGTIVGQDGKDCDMELVRSQVAAFLATIEKPKDGKDGAGFDDVDMQYDGDRKLSFVFFQGTDKAKSFDFILPIPLVRDIWRKGTYQRGDITIRGGSMYIAVKDTASEPGVPDSDWKLCTKCGRDGIKGERGPKGEKGTDGRNGRDLTQVGTDGSKWG